jgi:tRNA(His) guanylyltransferase
MAKSRFEYVRNFELPDPLLQGTYIVVRVDGRGFHKYVDLSCSWWFVAYPRFSDTHAFEKPNDVRALELMDMAAKTVMTEYKDVVLAFGESDEYRWVHVWDTMPGAKHG